MIGNAAKNRIRAAFDGVAVKEQAVIASPLAYAPAQRAKTSDAFAAVRRYRTTALWGEAYGGWAHADGDGNASGYSRNTGGFVTGLDGVVADDWRIGVLAGYGNTSLDSGASNASVDNYSIGLYGGTAWDNLRLSLGTALTQNEIDTDRMAVFGDLVNSHSASYDAKIVQVFGELGYAIKTPYADFEPFAAASYVHLKTGRLSGDRRDQQSDRAGRNERPDDDDTRPSHLTQLCPERHAWPDGERAAWLEPCLRRCNAGGKVGLCWRPALHGPGAAGRARYRHSRGGI